MSIIDNYNKDLSVLDSKIYTKRVDKNSMLLLNRLSDYFYALGRVLCDKLGESEFLWEK